MDVILAIVFIIVMSVFVGLCFILKDEIRNIYYESDDDDEENE